MIIGATLLGTLLGGLTGYSIGGIGIAAVGTAIGIPALATTVVGGGSGAAIGYKLAHLLLLA